MYQCSPVENALWKGSGLRVLHYPHSELVLGTRDEIIKNDAKSLDMHGEDFSTSGRYCLVVDARVPTAEGKKSGHYRSWLITSARERKKNNFKNICRRFREDHLRSIYRYLSEMNHIYYKYTFWAGYTHKYLSRILVWWCWLKIRGVTVSRSHSQASQLTTGAETKSPNSMVLLNSGGSRNMPKEARTRSLSQPISAIKVWETL